MATSRAALEVGWTIDHASLNNHGGPFAIQAKPFDEFPILCSLVSQAMVALGKPMDDITIQDRLNVSCLLYSPGHSIGWHQDRPYCYEDAVYGCILFNNSDSALEFHQGDGNGKLLRRFVVPEQPGTCFCQQGQARYEWQHGVPPLGHGERLSVTWRWFLDSVPLMPGLVSSS